MGVTVNKITKEDVGNGGGAGKLYTGKAVMKVIAINPDQAQLQSFGFKQEKPPVYRTDKGQRVAVFVQAQVGEGETKIAHASFFLKPEKAAGMFINKTGNWGKDSDKLGSTARTAYVGEINLIEFIKVWVNSKRDQEVSLDSIDALVHSGSVQELLQIKQAAGENEFYGLLYVQDEKYQAVYTTFERLYSKSSEYLHKQLVKEWDKLKGDFGPISTKLFRESDFALRAYGKPASEAPGKAAKVVDDLPAQTNQATAAQPTSQHSTQQAQAVTADVESDDAPF